MIRLRNPKLLQPGDHLHGKAVDLVIQDGTVQSLQPASDRPLAEGDIDLKGAWISAGWWDGQVDFRDPGMERAEGLLGGLKASAQGGFTRVAPVSSTHPCRDQPSEISSLIHRSANMECGVIPIAALSMGRKGTQLSEAFALKEAGARAFSDDLPIDRPELLRRALEYHQPSGLPVFSDAHDPHFQPDGVMHEGAMSIALGLQGNSGESELLRVNRDLDILRYTGGRLHFPIMTTAAGLAAVRVAKEEGLSVTCGTSIHHLCWTDQDLDGFNTDMKLLPPLRSKEDRNALRQAALDGALDLVVSDHRPRTPEEHDVDFMMVRPGIAGVHAMGPALMGALSDHGANDKQILSAIYALLCEGPRKLLGDAESLMPLSEGGAAEITAFSLTEGGLPQSFSKAPNAFYTHDTPKLRGRVLGTVTPRGSHWN